MKRNLTLLVGLFMVVFVSSCGKDDKTNETQNPLIGKWWLHTQVEAGKEFTEQCQENRYLLFSEKDFEVNQSKVDENGYCKDNLNKVAYTISGDNITFESNGQKASYPFSIKDDVLTVTIGSVTQTYKKNIQKELPPAPVNSFIGTWNLESMIVNNLDETTDCIKKQTMIVTNNTISVNYYDVNPSNNSCEKGENIIYYYTFSNGKVENIKDKEGKLIDGKVTFSIENGKLVVTSVSNTATAVANYKKQ